MTVFEELKKFSVMILAYSLFILSIVVIFSYDYYFHKRCWYDPLYLYLFFLVIYVSPLSVRYILDLGISGNVTYMYYDLRNIFPFSIVLVSVSNFVFYIAYRVRFLNLNLLKKYKKKPRYYRFLSLSGIFLFLIGFSIFLYMTSTHGGFLKFILSGYGVTEYFSENPLLATSIPIMFVSGLFFFYAFIETGKKINIFMSFGVFAFLIMLSIVLGRRAEIVSWGLIYIINYTAIYKRIKFSYILVLFVFGFVFLNILGVVRQSNYHDLSNFYERVIDKTSGDGSSSYNMFYTLVDGQFAVPYEVLPVLMETMEFDEFKLGSTFFDNVGLWIPRFLWTGKGHGISSWYYHKYYDPSAPPNEGRQFFFLAEGYLNFGVFGVLFWAALWGIIWRYIGDLYKRSSAYGYVNYFGIFVFSVYTGNMLKLQASSLPGIFVVMVKQTILWYVLGAFVAIILSEVFRYVKVGE